MSSNGGWRRVSGSLEHASCDDGRRKQRPRKRWRLCSRVASGGVGFYRARAGSGALYFLPAAIYFDSLLNWDVCDVDRECKAKRRQRALQCWDWRMQTAEGSKKFENGLGLALSRSDEHFHCDHALQYRSGQNR